MDLLIELKGDFPVKRESRRKIIKGLIIAMPAVWVMPMVESITLPAHARTSPDCGSFNDVQQAAEVLCADLNPEVFEDCLECVSRLAECGFTNIACAQKPGP